MNVYLTETQLSYVLEESIQRELLSEAFNGLTLQQAISRIPALLKKGVKISVILAMLYATYNLTDEQKQQILKLFKGKEETEITQTPMKIADNKNEWNPVQTPVIGTVYNAVPRQCNKDYGRTASMFRLNLNDVLSHRIIAMERTFMQNLGLQYGDVIKVEGSGNYDGVWVVQDTMNKKFANLPKIDFLVPKNIKTGKWDNLQIYVLKDKSLTDTVKTEENIAPQLSKEDFSQQQKLIAQRKI